MTIQVQSVNKTEGTIRVTFDPGFNSQPIVIVSPYWKGGGIVGHAPTITDIDSNGCSITSGNTASNYFVNVMAVDREITTVGSLKATAGSDQKTASLLEIQFPFGALTSPVPVTLLSSFWEGSGSGVGAIDTIDDLAVTGCKVISGNAATNYYTNFLAMEIGVSTVTGQTVVTGIANKTGSGLLRVYFPKVFNNPPKVFVSPWWNDANAGVGNIETVHQVNEHYFEVNSGNAAANYFVTWAAVGS